VHKIAFHIGSLAIYWYGVLIAIGVLVGIWTASRRALRDHVAPEQIVDLGPWLIIGAVVGARLLYVITFWREFFARQPFWEIFMIRHGGMVFYGGLIGALIAGYLYVRLKRISFWKMADILAPSIALGHVFGRIGCLMFGCCYGRPTHCAWAIYFPADHETGGQSVHPTQIYEALLNFGLYLTLAWLYRRKKFEGQIFASYLMGYAVIRSFVEIFRGDYSVYYLGGYLTSAQLVSIVLLAAGSILWWQRARGAAKRDA
jgi:phosphatidylglycerol:prolipoprotein diacylglycerol transferase